MVYAEHLLSFWLLKFWYMLSIGYLHDQPLEKLQAQSLSWAFLVDNISHMLSQLIARGIKCVLWERIPLGEDSRKFVPSFLQTSSNVPFPFAYFSFCPFTVINHKCWVSLVAQWLRVGLPMQGTRVWALVWEDPACRRATRPMSHNYWACVSGACAPQGEATTVRGPRTAMKSGPRLPQLEKALAQKRRPNTAKNKNK